MSTIEVEVVPVVLVKREHVTIIKDELEQRVLEAKANLNEARAKASDRETDLVRANNELQEFLQSQKDQEGQKFIKPFSATS